MTDRHRADMLKSFEPIRLQMTERTTHLLFRIRTSRGLEGWGEASMSGDDEEASDWAQKLFVECLADQPVAAVAVLTDRLKGVATPLPTTILATAISGLDQALWDVRAQQLDVPIYELLGGPRRRQVRLYANINRGLQRNRSADAFATRAQEAVRCGLRMVKCAPFDDVVPETAHPTLPAVQLGLDRVAAVRDAIGPDIGLMVDCHGRLDHRTVNEILPILESLGLRWLEEPLVSHRDMHRLTAVPPSGEVASVCSTNNDVVLEAEAVATLADTTTLPFAGGEFFFGVSQFEQVLSTGSLRYVMPDVKHCGGLWEAVRIAAVADAKGVAVTPHNPCGPISTIASAHVCAALPEVDSLEYQWGEIPGRADLVQPREHVVDGYLVVPEGAGLGVQPNRDAISEYRVATTA